MFFQFLTRIRTTMAYTTFLCLCATLFIYGEGGDMGTCQLDELQACVTEPEGPEEGCRMIRQVIECVDTFEEKCKNKAFKTDIDFVRNRVDYAIGKCKENGYSTDPDGAGENIKPSYMLVLAAAILLAVRVHF